MPRPIKFNLRRIACGGDKVRPIQKFERFLQFPFWPGRMSQPNNGGCHLNNDQSMNLANGAIMSLSRLT
jgi:hypothetical protein